MENHVQINSHTCRWLGRLQWLHTGNGGWIDGKVFDFCSNTEPHHTALLYATFDRLLWLLLTFSCLLKLLWFLRNSVWRDYSSATVTASHRPYEGARVGPRPDQSDEGLASSGWTTLRLAVTRGAVEWQKHPLRPHTYLPPLSLSLSMLGDLFSGRPDFLCDGAMDERRKRGMG